MSRRVAVALVVCLAGLGGIATSQAIGAGSSTIETPTQLWEQFPLEPQGQQAAGGDARTTPTRTPPPTPATAPSSSGTDPLVWIIGAVLLLGAPLLLVATRRRRDTASHGLTVLAQTGALTPLTPAFRPPPASEGVDEDEEELRGQEEDEPGELDDADRIDPFAELDAPGDLAEIDTSDEIFELDDPEKPGERELFDPTGPIHLEDLRVEEELALAPTPQPILPPADRDPDPTPEQRLGETAASTYEIVWYRQGERLMFGLQPLDGRATRAGRERSGSFRWDEDEDPPSTLRDAQRAHGRLRSRLLRDGWTAAGRGRTWFSHRLRPPER